MVQISVNDHEKFLSIRRH